MTYECKYSYSASTELKIKIDKQSNELEELKKIIQGLEE